MISWHFHGHPCSMSDPFWWNFSETGSTIPTCLLRLVCFCPYLDHLQWMMYLCIRLPLSAFNPFILDALTSTIFIWAILPLCPSWIFDRCSQDWLWRDDIGPGAQEPERAAGGDQEEGRLHLGDVRHLHGAGRLQVILRVRLRYVTWRKHAMSRRMAVWSLNKGLGPKSTELHLKKTGLLKTKSGGGGVPGRELDGYFALRGPNPFLKGDQIVTYLIISYQMVESHTLNGPYVVADIT